MKEIKSCIEKWNNNNPKPQNDVQFITAFVEFAQNADFDQWSFTGENGYCGYTATIYEYPQSLPLVGLGFEFAYGSTFVRVFTNQHNGFWVPEYINLKGEDAKELLCIIKESLNGWTGFNSFDYKET